jgi:hypothetical protein
MARADTILIVDTEGGYQPKEIGAILFSIKHGIIVQQFS